MVKPFFPQQIDTIEERYQDFKFLRIIVTVPRAQVKDAKDMVLGYLQDIGEADDYIVVVDGLFMEPDAPWVFGVEE